MIVSQRDARSVRIEHDGFEFSLAYRFWWEGRDRSPESIAVDGDRVRAFFLSAEIRDIARHRRARRAGAPRMVDAEPGRSASRSTSAWSPTGRWRACSPGSRSRPASPRRAWPFTGRARRGRRPPASPSARGGSSVSRSTRGGSVGHRVRVGRPGRPAARGAGGRPVAAVELALTLPGPDAAGRPVRAEVRARSNRRDTSKQHARSASCPHPRAGPGCGGGRGPGRRRRRIGASGEEAKDVRDAGRPVPWGGCLETHLYEGRRGGPEGRIAPARFSPPRRARAWPCCCGSSSRTTRHGRSSRCAWPTSASRGSIRAGCSTSISTPIARSGRGCPAVPTGPRSASPTRPAPLIACSLSPDRLRVAGLPHRKYQLAGERFVEFFFDDRGRFQVPGAVHLPGVREPLEPGITGLEVCFPLARVLAATGHDRHRKALDALAHELAALPWGTPWLPSTGEGRDPDSAGALLAARVLLELARRDHRRAGTHPENQGTRRRRRRGLRGAAVGVRESPPAGRGHPDPRRDRRILRGTAARGRGGRGRLGASPASRTSPRSRGCAGRSRDSRGCASRSPTGCRRGLRTSGISRTSPPRLRRRTAAVAAGHDAAGTDRPRRPDRPWDRSTRTARPRGRLPARGRRGTRPRPTVRLRPRATRKTARRGCVDPARTPGATP